MSLTNGLQLPFGIQPVNPVPVDSWSGPYVGVDETTAINLANSSIPQGVRFQSMEVRLIINGVSKKYWYRDGVTDIHLVSSDSDTPSLQDVIDVDKIADRVQFTKRFFTNGAFTPLPAPNNTIFFMDYKTTSTGFYLYGRFASYDGTAAIQVVKINNDGTIDNTFTPPTSVNDVPYSTFTLLPEVGTGKLLVGGLFTSFNGVSVNRLVRLNTNGSVDNTFTIGTGFNNYLTGMAYTTDLTKIYIAGQFTSFNGTGVNRLVRLNLDGTIDTGFNIGTGFGNASLEIVTNTDGTLYVTSYSTTYNSISSPGIVKILSTGAIDTSFNAGTGISPTGSNNVHKIIMLSDGKILLYSNTMTSYNGTAVGRIVKLNHNGTIDTSFNAGTGFNNSVDRIIRDSNNRLLVTGTFTTYNGLSSYNGVTINGTIVLNEDGSVYRIPLSTMDSSQGGYFEAFFQLQNGGYVGLSNNTFNILNSNFIPQNTKTLSFSEVTGRGTYNLEHYEEATQYELLNKKVTEIFVNDKVKEKTGNFITGTAGNTNYVSKFTGSGTIVNSQVFDNGTNIGIGTITPTTKLQIIGTVSASEFRVSGGTSSQFLKGDGSLDSKVYVPVATGSPVVTNGIWMGTEAQYLAITTPDPNTIYIY